MFCALKTLQKIRSRIFVNTHTPKTSATMAAPTFKGSAISLIVTDFCLSTPLITIPQPPLSSSLKLPSQKPRIAFYVVGLRFPCRYQFSFSPVCPCRPSCLLPYHVLCGRVSRNCRCSRSVWQLLSSTMNARFFEFSLWFIRTLFLGQILL